MEARKHFMRRPLQAAQRPSTRGADRRENSLIAWVSGHSARGIGAARARASRRRRSAIAQANQLGYQLKRYFSPLRVAPATLACFCFGHEERFWKERPSRLWLTSPS